MRHLATLGLLLLSACAPQKPASSAIADESVVPANLDDVQQYPDQVPLAEKQTIEWKAAPVRHAHPDGRLVAILTRGNPVSKVGRRGDFFLITFPNPSNPTQRWSGWVHKNVFLPGTEAYPPIGNPPRCQHDLDCGALAKCSGNASTGASGLDGFRFCAGK